MTILSSYFPVLFFFFLSFLLSLLLPSIMNLFKKNTHSFLTLIAHTVRVHLQSHPSIASGLGLITAARDLKALPDVVESATEMPTPLPSTTIKRDPGGIGFIDHDGGEVDGWMSCAESLGCESCDERRVDDQMEKIKYINVDEYDDSKDCGGVCGQRMRTAEGRGNRRKANSEKKEVKPFPPPLSSLNRNGQPCFFLRPARKDGRLELTEVRIHRPEILQASRENGRLRLHLIPDENVLELEEEIQEEEIKQMIRYEEEEEEEEKKKVDGEEWKKFAMAGSEAFRRCHEMVNHHHGIHGSHHHVHVCEVGIV